MRYLRRYPIYLLAWTLIAALMTGVSILCAQTMSALTDYLAGHGLTGSEGLTAEAASLYGASAAAEMIFLIVCGLAGGYAFAAMSRSSLRAVTTIPVDNILMQQQGDLINRASADTEEALTVLKETLPGVILKSVRLVLVIAFLLWIAPAVTGIYLAAVCASVLLQVLISRSEAFAHYVLSQPRDMWLNTSVLFDWTGESLCFYEMNVVRGVKPNQVRVTRRVLEEDLSDELLESPAGKKLADSRLNAHALRLLGHHPVSSCFLTGRGTTSR